MGNFQRSRHRERRILSISSIISKCSCSLTLHLAFKVIKDDPLQSTQQTYPVLLTLMKHGVDNWCPIVAGRLLAENAVHSYSSTTSSILHICISSA